MKLVRCVLKGNSWQQTVSNLEPVVAGMTIWEMRDVSPGSTRTAFYRGRRYDVNLPGILIEIVTDESWLEDVLREISGSHCVQIFSVEESHRIRDGFMEI